MTETVNCFSVPPRKRTIFDRLFPAKYVDLPDAPSEFKDVLHVNSRWTLDWKDRIRVLLSGRVETRVKVVCENEVGATVSRSEYWAVNPFSKEYDG
jgi:hypothetical protein